MGDGKVQIQEVEEYSDMHASCCGPSVLKRLEFGWHCLRRYAAIVTS